MKHFCLSVLLTIVFMTVNAYSVRVNKMANNCIVSLTVPKESIKTVCDKDNTYYIDQKLKSVDSRLSSFKREIDNINVKLAYTLARSTKHKTDVSKQTFLLQEHVEKLFTNFQKRRNKNKQGNLTENDQTLVKSRSHGKNMDESNLKARLLAKKKKERVIRNLLRRELRGIRGEIIKDLMRKNEFNLILQGFSHLNKNDETLSKEKMFLTKRSHAKDVTSTRYRPPEYVQADSSVVENGLRIKGDFDMNSRFEEIERDIETLANGFMSLHENMFEIKDVRKQFDTEKKAMENELLTTLRDEYRILDMKLEYVENQTIIISRLLQATVKTQHQMQASVKIFNATFKLRSAELYQDIAKLSAEISAINSTLNPNYLDAFSFDDAMTILDIKDTISSVKEMKMSWHTLRNDLAIMRERHEDLFRTCNFTVKSATNLLERKVRKNETKKEEEEKKLKSIYVTNEGSINLGNSIRLCSMTITVLVFIQRFV